MTNTPNALQLFKKAMLFGGFLFLTNLECALAMPVFDSHTELKLDLCVTNTCDRTDRIRDVVPNCSCVSVMAYPYNDINPGQNSMINACLNLTGQEGMLEKRLCVHWTFSKVSIEIPIKVFVRVRCDLRPRDAAFGVVPVEQATTLKKAVNLYGYVVTNDVAARIVGVDPPAQPIFSVQQADDDRSVSVMLSPEFLARTGSKIGRYAETWKVRTSDPEIPVIDLPVSVLLSGDLSVAPSVWTIGFDEPICSRTAMLRRKDRKPFKVLSVETKPRSWGKARIESRPLGGWRVVVSEIDAREVRQFSRKPYLEVKTDVPGSDCIEIPLRVEKPSAELANVKKGD